MVLGDLDALDALHDAIRARRVHPSWMSSRSQGRATIHQLAGRVEYRPGTVVTVARRG
jgi:hypothetical protein